ncbi:MAG: hypothetical protein K2F79_09740, partial [Muribaculaceae bacterium]|nr:hypothetical protein [Muribaculaceae bacterium]
MYKFPTAKLTKKHFFCCASILFFCQYKIFLYVCRMKNGPEPFRRIKNTADRAPGPEQLFSVIQAMPRKNTEIEGCTLLGNTATSYP